MCYYVPALSSRCYYPSVISGIKGAHNITSLFSTNSSSSMNVCTRVCLRAQLHGEMPAVKHMRDVLSPWDVKLLLCGAQCVSFTLCLMICEHYVTCNGFQQSLAPSLKSHPIYGFIMCARLVGILLCYNYMQFYALSDRVALILTI